MVVNTFGTEIFILKFKMNRKEKSRESRENGSDSLCVDEAE